MRMVHEAEYHHDSIFLTLTYNDEFLPKDLNVDKVTLTLFFKRLRKALEPRKIKYFACGEYGEDGRAHYHAIIFGLSPCYTCWSCMETHSTPDTPKNDCATLRQCWTQRPGSISPGPKNPAVKEQRTAGSIGFIDIKPVTYKSSRYVANYLLKALNVQTKRTVKPFTLMSNGLGKQYLLDNLETIKKQKTIRIDGTQRGLPKYYVDLIHKTDPEWDPRSEQSKKRNKEVYDHYNTKYTEKEDYSHNIEKNSAIRAHRAQADKNLQAKEKLKRGSL